ncbi:MAG: glycosyltransferase family 9 protein [Gemmatimonadota bacterium]|nr:glycosyltransferase family 9 protein [Gemmatimonadota bacterium]
MRRILVVEPKHIGDVVLAIPFLAQLRARFPKSKTTLLSAPHAKEILDGMGLVDEFIETDLGWTERATKYNPFGYNWRELWRLKRELQDREFDLAFKCCMHIREHVVMGLSGAERRIGYAFGEGDNVLTDAIPVADPDRHKVDDWLLLLKPFGGAAKIEVPRLRVAGAERRWADQFLLKRGVSRDETVIGIHPGASVAEKRWPLERFREVGEVLSERGNMRILVLVDPAGYGVSLGEIPGAITAQVGLRELIALIERSSLLVCNDSGPMHIAGALGVPTVAVFGSGIEQWFSPLGEGHQLLTLEKTPAKQSERNSSVKPFDIAGLTTSQVLAAVDRVLRANRN